MLKLNETPIRTANNFRINNIEIDAQIPEIIPEFENVQIIKENSEIDEAVSNKELVFGNNKELENIVFSKANSKIRIVNNQKNENVKITYTFDEDSQVLLNQIDIVASKNINVVIEYKSETEKECFHAGIIRTFASDGANINVTVVNLLNDVSTNIESYENDIEADSKVYHKLIDIGAKESISNYFSNTIGNKADNDLKTIYLGQGSQVKDLNYIVVVLTKNAGYRKKVLSPAMQKLYRKAYSSYPNVVRTILRRSFMYNKTMNYLDVLERKGEIFVIRPHVKPVSRLERNREALYAFYEHGYHYMERQLEALEEYLEK